MNLEEITVNIFLIIKKMTKQRKKILLTLLYKKNYNKKTLKKTSKIFMVLKKIITQNIKEVWQIFTKIYKNIIISIMIFKIKITSILLNINNNYHKIIIILIRCCYISSSQKIIATLLIIITIFNLFLIPINLKILIYKNIATIFLFKYRLKLNKI